MSGSYGGAARRPEIRYIGGQLRLVRRRAISLSIAIIIDTTIMPLTDYCCCCCCCCYRWSL